MLPQSSHITRKRGTYYFRRRLPHPLVGEVAISLRTRQFRHAEYLAEALALRWNTCVQTDQMIDQSKLAAILRAELDRLLAQSREKIINTPYGKSVFNHSFNGPERDAQKADLERCDWAIHRFTSDLAKRDLRAPEGRIRDLMREHDVPDEDFQRFGLAWFRMYIEFIQQERKWIAEGPFSLDEALSERSHPRGASAGNLGRDQASSSQAGPRAEILLSDFVPKFVELMVSTGEWKGQTEAQNKATYRMFIEVCGDRPVTDYARRDCATFYDVLRGLPALYSKKPEWSRRPIVEVTEETKELDVERLSMKTVKRHFAALGRLFDELRTRGEYSGENPAYGFNFPSGRVRANEGRMTWEGENLKKLFSSPVWTGCASPARRSTPGTVILRDEKYWLPLLALYQGNRLEECAQLLRSDVRCEEGIWLLDINDDDGKQLKNAQSKRIVPLHPTLIELGFVDYVEQAAPTPSSRVFLGLEPGGPDNKLGYSFSKWFTRYRQDIGIYQKGLDYHSFRHSVVTKLFNAGANPPVVRAIVGHEGIGTSEKSYLHQFSIPVLLEAIKTIEWSELQDLIPQMKRR